MYEEIVLQTSQILKDKKILQNCIHDFNSLNEMDHFLEKQIIKTQ